MCTLIYHQNLGILVKNRDKNEPTSEIFHQNGDVLAVATEDTDYFGLAVNKYGVAFVSAAVNSPQWTSLAEQGQAAAARKHHAQENKGRVSPTRVISENLYRAKSIDYLIDLIESAKYRWAGYNVLLADRKKTVLIETWDDRATVEELTGNTVVTNHFMHLGYGPQSRADYPSSFDRKSEAETSIHEMTNEKLDMLMAPGGTKDDLFWRYGNFFTVSSSIIDIANRSIKYLPLNTTGYQVHGFN